MQRIISFLRFFFFFYIRKPFYKLVSNVDGIGQVYSKKNKLALVVENEAMGKRLYAVLQDMVRRKAIIQYSGIQFIEIKKYAVNEKQQVTLFYMRVQNLWKERWDNFNTNDKLREMVSFTGSMQAEGYYLDGTCFENEKADSLIAFLSYFTLDEKKGETAKGCLVEYIHYVFSSGGDLKSFYQGIDSTNMLYSISTFFPYALPVILMCYHYYQTGMVEENIYEVLSKNRRSTDEDDYLIVSNPDLSHIASLFKKIEQTDEYVLYEYDTYHIKILSYVTYELEKFLRDENGFLRSHQNALQEQVEAKIIDFSGHIIGYQFTCLQNDLSFSSYRPISSASFKRQSDIFHFIEKLVAFLEENIPDTSKSGLKVDNNTPVTRNAPVTIKDLLVLQKGESFDFKIANCLDFSYLAKKEKRLLKQELTFLFFEIYHSYLEQKYGKLSRKQVLRKREVKYLRPCLTEELLHFAFKKPVDIAEATKELFTFLGNHSLTEDGEFYDTNMEFNPTKISFIFDYEAEEKYGLKLHAGMEEILPDGRRIITFKRKKEVADIKKRITSFLQEIHQKLGEIEDENVSIIGISEIIYSQSISIHKEYLVYGIITTPIFTSLLQKKENEQPAEEPTATHITGKLLTEEEILHLNNKDILQMAGYLLSKFGKHSINLNYIWRDANNHFVIDIFQKDFHVSNTCSSYSEYIKQFISYLRDIHYPVYAFKNVKDTLIDSCGIYGPQGSANSKEYIMGRVEYLNTFCQEHGIYYYREEEAKDNWCPACGWTKFLVLPQYLDTSRILWEDEFATHYLLWDEKVKATALKVYKQSVTNKEELEKNIDRIISQTLLGNATELLQDCFVPTLKAVDEENHFIGYVYELGKSGENLQASEELIDLKDPQLKNLPRIKSLIRLVLQVQELLEQGLYFIQNPFQHVFLSKAHKKQVQIFNIELLGTEEKRNETIQWTAEYIKEVIESDSSISINMISLSNYELGLYSELWLDSKDNLWIILDILQSLEKKMTKYCPIHKMYYFNNYWTCPLCMGKEQMGNIRVEEIATGFFEDQEPMNEGGESFIYPYGKSSVAKIFKTEEVNCDAKAIILSRVLQRKEVLEELNKQNKPYQYIVPNTILLDEYTHQLVGYVMKEVKAGKPISVLRDKLQIKKLGFTRRDVLEILIAIGEGLEVLHSEANIYIGDLNGRNILLDTSKRVYFLEFDSVGIDEFAPVFCTDGYIDPISKRNKNISAKDDWYSFAIQAFYYLTFTHPFNGIYYEEVAGRKVLLDITDKMERKISLLGNHEMEPPDVAVPWDWMTENLKNAFLSIFEGDNRESIVPYLKEQYEKLYGNSSKSVMEKIYDTYPEIAVSDLFLEKFYVVHPNFIAIPENLFKGNVVRVINHHAAICSSQDIGQYLALRVKGGPYTVLIKSTEKVQDVLFSEDNKIAFVLYWDTKLNMLKFRALMLSIFAVITGGIPITITQDAQNFVVNGRTLYFTGTTEEGENVIYQREILDSEEVKSDKIKFLADQETKGFLVKENSKFVMVKHSEDVTDTVYCNDEALCDIPCKKNSSTYNVLYDDASKWWLVMNSEGKGVLFTTSQNGFCRISLPEDMGDIKVDNLFFYKKKIYLPSQNRLYIITFRENDQISIKEMECRKIMTPNSKICSINPDGFTVLTNNRLYKVCKKGGKKKT